MYYNDHNEQQRHKHATKKKSSVSVFCRCCDLIFTWLEFNVAGIVNVYILLSHDR